VAVTIGGKKFICVIVLVIISRSAEVSGVVSQGVGGAWLLIVLVSGFSKEEEEERERNY
jgi:hypothetical protein